MKASAACPLEISLGVIFKALKYFKKIDFLRCIRWVLAAGIAAVLVYLPLDFFEFYLYDLRVELRPTSSISPQIETVYINPSSVQAFKGMPAFKEHIQFLKNLQSEKPKALIYLINPSELEGNDADKALFVKLSESFQNFYYLSNTDDLMMRGEVGKLDLPGLLKDIRVLTGPITYDLKVFAQDGVTRRMMLTYQGNILFHPFIVSQLIPERAQPKNIRGHFDFYDSEQTYIDMAPAGSFAKIPFVDIVRDNFTKGKFTDKIILIGTDLGKSTKEYIKTSYSRSVTAMTVTEAHANMLNTLIQNSAPKSVPPWVDTIILLVMVILSVEVVLAMKPLRGIFVLGFTLFVFTLGSIIAFWFFGFWIKMAHPILGVFISYYFLIPYRLIMENRKSWELSQKNKLLTQVEELKTNFIGMMSHDLKTPLARIQGMIEVVSRDKNPLSEEQKTAIKSIRRSTEDLLNFISTILNFSRLESEGAHLNLKSKDINILINEVVAKCEDLAQIKTIKIITELEPLFSLKLDPDLMRQVILNLVENAIKYSPVGTEVKIKSEEKDGKVLVSIIDQGAGISKDELPRLFMKFFRSRNAKSSSVKGSGLGLYLSKYFVELHKGQLTVLSEENKGSIFTIELPLA